MLDVDVDMVGGQVADSYKSFVLRAQEWQETAMRRLAGEPPSRLGNPSRHHNIQCDAEFRQEPDLPTPRRVGVRERRCTSLFQRPLSPSLSPSF